jgi:hypothetical protein
LLLLSSFGTAVAQTTPTKSTVFPKTTIPKLTNELPEHKALRIEYERTLAKCDQLVATAVSIIDKGTATSGLIVCDPGINLYDNEIHIMDEKLKAGNTIIMQLDARDGVPSGCINCSSIAQLEAASQLLKDVSVTGHLYNQLDSLRNRLKQVDPCLAVYHATIDKKASDLTVRQSELITGCKGLGLYPPPKE